MKKTIFIIAALAAPALAVAQSDARPVSLPEALTMAKKNSPNMVSARGQLRTSAMSLRTAKWAFSPLNNVQFSYGSSTGGGGSYVDGILVQRPATQWSFSQGFGNASLTIWDGGNKMSAVSRARAQIESAEINEVTQTFSIATQVKTQYYNILRQREALATATEQLGNAQFQYRLAVSRLTNGTATIADTLNSVIAIFQANNSILNARNSLDNANAQLTRLTGSDIPVTAILSDTTDPPPLQITDRELFALAEQGPAVRSSAAQIAVAKAQEKSAKAVLWPTITAGGSFSRNNQEKSSGGFDGYDFGAGPMNYSWGFNIGMSFTIWNGFQRESQILSARVQRDNAEANLREAKLTARQNITQQIGQLRTNEAQLGLGRLQLAAALEALRVIQRRYELGAATQLELNNAQQQVTTARNTLSNSKFDVRNARAAIEALIGREIQQ